MNHYPEWFNVYNRVKVVVNTPNVGVTEKDFELIHKIQ